MNALERSELTNNYETPDSAVPPATTQRGRRLLLGLLKLLISAALLGWVLRQVELRHIVDLLAAANIFWLIVAAALPCLGLALTATRWGCLLWAHGVQMTRGELIQSCAIARFVSQFLPTTIGGDIVRGYDSWRAGASKTVSVTALVTDRLLGLLALILFSTIAISLPNPLTSRQPALYLWLALSAAVAAIVIAVLFATPRMLAAMQRLVASLPAPLQPFATKLVSAATAYAGHRTSLLWALLYAVLLQINVVLFYFAIGQALGLSIDLRHYFLIVPLAVFAMMAPVTINGIGIREGVFSLMLGAYGVEMSQAVAFAWLEHGLFLAYGLMGGIVLACRRSREARKATI